MTPNDVMGQLTAALIGWAGLLKDPQYVRNGNTITWVNAQNIMLPEQLTRDRTRELSRNRQFSFRIASDDSVLQIGYKFGPDGVKQARLAFYEVGLLEESDLDSIYPLPEEDEINPVRWVRFDYNSETEYRVLHMNSHLHMSGLPGTRFAVAGVPSPKQFIEFVFSHFYPTDYEMRRLNGDGRFESFQTIDAINADRFNCGADPMEVYRRVPHLLIPGF